MEKTKTISRAGEIFLVDKNSSFNSPLKEKNLSHQLVWEKVGAELFPASRKSVLRVKRAQLMLHTGVAQRIK